MGKELAIRHPGGVYTDYELWSDILGEDDLPLAELVKKPNPKYKPIPPEVRQRIREKKATALAEAAAVRLWDESEHPREPSGSSTGGEFTSGGGSGGGSSESSASRLVDSDYSKPMPGDFRVKEYDEGWSDRQREAFGVDGGKSTAQVFERASETLGVNAQELTRGMARAAQEFSTNGVIQVSQIADELFRMRIESETSDGPVHITRTFSKNMDGTLSVHHDYFTLSEGAQGKGIATQYLEDSLKVYEKYNVSSISMLANIDVGGYAWGKLGFQAANPDEFADTMTWRTEDGALRSTWHAHGLDPDKTAKEVVRVIKAAGKDAPFALANMPGGKELMLNSDWDAVMNLRGTSGATFKKLLHDKIKNKKAVKHGA